MRTVQVHLLTDREMALTYLHSIAGRIRVKIPRVRGSEENANKLEEQLTALPGIDCVRANPTTGNVLILYSPELIEQRDIIRALRRLRWFRRQGRHAHGAGSVPALHHTAAQRAVENAIAVILELAVTRLIWI